LARTLTRYNVQVQAQKQGAEKAVLTLEKMSERQLLTVAQMARTNDIIKLMKVKTGE
jgi:hypothetical protein